MRPPCNWCLRKDPPLQSAGCNQRPSRGPRPFGSLLRWGPRKCTFRNPGCRRDRPGRDAFRCSRRPDSRYRPRERRTFGRTSRTIGERTTFRRAAPLEEPGASACPARRGPCRFGLGHCSCGRHARAAGWTATSEDCVQELVAHRDLAPAIEDLRDVVARTEVGAHEQHGLRAATAGGRGAVHEQTGGRHVTSRWPK